MTGRADYYAPGDWNAVCFECGMKRKAGTLIRNWKGYWVCPEHWEPRQAQDFVRAIPEKPAPPWIQPPSDTFLNPGCFPNDRTAIPDLAIPGCVIPNNLAPGNSFSNGEV